MAAKKKPSKPSGLSERQRRFVEAYIACGNAAEAARRAGYAEHTANRMGSENLSKPDIRAAIDAGRAKASAQAEVDAARVLRELSLLAFSDLGDVLDFSGTEPRLRPACEIPANARRAISSIKVKRVFEGEGDGKHPVDVIEFKLWDKLSALEKVGKHLGMWKERSPLEVLLDGLDAGLAAAIRRALGEVVPTRAGGPGGGEPPRGDAPAAG